MMRTRQSACLTSFTPHFWGTIIVLSLNFTNARLQDPQNTCAMIRPKVEFPESKKVNDILFEYENLVDYGSYTPTEDDFWELTYDMKTKKLVCTLKKEVDAEDKPANTKVKFICNPISEHEQEYTVDFIIQDVNDVQPKFVAKSLSFSVPESWPIGVDLTFLGDDILFEDGDVTNDFKKGEVTFRNTDDGDMFGLTLVGQKVGLQLKKPLNFEGQKVYNIILQVGDSTLSSKKDVMTVKVKVSNVVDESPRFNQEYYQALMDSTNPTRFTVTVKTEDMDDDKSETIKYSFSSLNGIPDDQFKIDESTGIFTASSKFQVDESINPMLFKIIGTKSENLMSSAVLAVFLESSVSVQWSKVFRNPFQNVTVTENEVADNFFTLEFIDASSPEFSMKEQTPPDHFTVHPTTGQISLTKALDREVTQVAWLTIAAKAKAAREGDENKEDVTVVMVDILDQNDSPPQFTDKVYQSATPHLELSPWFRAASPLIQVQADDPDQNSNIIYSILDGADGKHFEIEPYSGKIFPTTGLSCQSECQLKVEANDGVNHESVDVKIQMIYWKNLVQAKLTMKDPVENFKQWLGGKLHNPLFLSIEESGTKRSMVTYQVYFCDFDVNGQVLPANEVIKTLGVHVEEDWGKMDSKETVKADLQGDPGVQTPESKLDVIILGVLLGIMAVLLIALFIWTRMKLDKLSKLSTTDRDFEMNGVLNKEFVLDESHLIFKENEEKGDSRKPSDSDKAEPSPVKKHQYPESALHHTERESSLAPIGDIPERKKSVTICENATLISEIPEDSQHVTEIVIEPSDLNKSLPRSGKMYSPQALESVEL